MILEVQQGRICEHGVFVARISQSPNCVPQGDIKEGGDPHIFSALIDGHSEFIPETGRRRPKFRIELPGNPILGDGKSDNQSHTIIFYRGEYLQLIDANQDNYLEEMCWPNARSLSFQTRVRTDIGIIVTLGTLLW